jgi:hypothetical protein
VILDVAEVAPQKHLDSPLRLRRQLASFFLHAMLPSVKCTIASIGFEVFRAELRQQIAPCTLKCKTRLFIARCQTVPLLPGLRALRQRPETVEHPFGTIKARMGATHFLMKTLPRLAAEMALHVLAYNMTRVMNIMGTKLLIAAMRA